MFQLGYTGRWTLLMKYFQAKKFSSKLTFHNINGQPVTLKQTNNNLWKFKFSLVTILICKKNFEIDHYWRNLPRLLQVKPVIRNLR